MEQSRTWPQGYIGISTEPQIARPTGVHHYRVDSGSLERRSENGARQANQAFSVSNPATARTSFLRWA